jgi:hypothetical protein
VDKLVSAELALSKVIPTQTIGGASFKTDGTQTVVGWGGENVVGKCWWGIRKYK